MNCGWDWQATIPSRRKWWAKSKNGVCKVCSYEAFILQKRQIHVSNDVYYSKLKDMHLQPQLLPLFSNIPFSSSQDSDWIYQALNLEKRDRNGVFVLMLFGTIHKEWSVNSVINKLKTEIKDRKIYLVSVGGQGYGKGLWQELSSLQSESFKTIKLGFRTEQEISCLLQFADAGLSTTPLCLFGKSGSAMAMVEHGLPIIVTRNELRFPFLIQKVEEVYPAVYMWDEVQEDKLLKSSRLTDRINKITYRFLHDLALIS